MLYICSAIHIKCCTYEVLYLCGAVPEGLRLHRWGQKYEPPVYRCHEGLVREEVNARQALRGEVQPGRSARFKSSSGSGMRFEDSSLLDMRRGHLDASRAK